MKFKLTKSFFKESERLKRVTDSLFAQFAKQTEAMGRQAEAMCRQAEAMCQQTEAVCEAAAAERNLVLDRRRPRRRVCKFSLS